MDFPQQQLRAKQMAVKQDRALQQEAGMEGNGKGHEMHNHNGGLAVTLTERAVGRCGGGAARSPRPSLEQFPRARRR